MPTSRRPDLEPGRPQRPRAIPRGTVAVVGAAALLAAACGSSGHRHVAAALPPTTPAPTTTTVAPTTTATTRPAPPVSPLTGLPQPNPTQLRSPAVVVKIDNVDAARPQANINGADVVYEEEVEGGLTRLAAVFQSSYPDPIGPIRSGRLTDIAIIDDLNHPVFAYAGTNGLFLPQLRAQPVTDLDIDNHGELFYRGGSAPAPHNLYARTTALAAASTTHAPPPALFPYLAPGQAFHGAGVAPAAGVTVSFPAATAAWTYDPASKTWKRAQNGTADVDQAGQQINATNVVLQFVSYFTSAWATGEGGPPAPIPEGQLLGNGQAWVLSGGKVVKGTWSRPGLPNVTAYADAKGAPIAVAPGRTWIELVPVGQTPAVTP
jgi:hypothetical protein